MEEATWQYARHGCSKMLWENMYDSLKTLK